MSEAKLQAHGRKYGRYALRHPLHMFWHPHQGFWNIYVSKLARPLRLRGIVIIVDTGVRCIQVILRRIRKLGLGSIFRGRTDVADGQRKAGADVLLLDLGLHKRPAEILKFAEWFAGIMSFRVFAYEAHSEYMAESLKIIEASGFFQDPDLIDCEDDRPTIHAFNYAVVAPDYSRDSVSLFLDERGGKGDSLFSERGTCSIDVPAIRLTEHLESEGVDLAKTISIVRMNIEGAELYVLQDLEAAKATQFIDGWYGMWDDLFKIEPTKDAELRALMKRNKIKSIPFNARDLKDGGGVRGVVFGFREWVIRYDIVTSILSGMRSKAVAQ